MRNRIGLYYDQFAPVTPSNGNGQTTTEPKSKLLQSILDSDSPVKPATNEPFTPIYTLNSGNITPPIPLNKNYGFNGVIIDSQTGIPIPGATITTYKGALPMQRVIADSNGQFSISADSQPDTINISSASYNDFSWPASEYQHTFELERNETQLPGVTVTSHPTNNSWMLLLLLIPLLAKKKAVSGTVGKVSTGDVLAVGAGVMMLTGFSVIKKMLEGLGLWDSKDTKDADAEAANPNSPWSPNFWKAGPSGTLLLRADEMNQMLQQIKDSFGWFDDDEQGPLGVFKSHIRTQSQLSFFADWFNTSDASGEAMGDLLTWLRGTSWPNDRLSDSEVAVIRNYISSLPKYKVT